MGYRGGHYITTEYDDNIVPVEEDTTEYDDNSVPVEEETTEYDDNIVPVEDETEDSCQMCQIAKSSANPHPCRRCGTPVCSVFCSDQDPDSTNEMHGVHKNPMKCLQASGTTLACPHCDEMFQTTVTFKNHIKEKHPAGFLNVSVQSITLLSEANNSLWKYTPCNQCGKYFYTDNDQNNHAEQVHEYGEYYNIYPCDMCGIMGSDVEEIETHKMNHDSYGHIEMRPTNKTKSFDMNTSNNDIDAGDDSDEDAEWTQTKD